MDTKIFRLNYLRPKDGLIAAQELLSADGKAQVIDDDKDIDDDDDGDNNSDESDRVNKDPVYKPNKQRFALNSALVVYDYKENIEKISDLIVKLDKRHRNRFYWKQQYSKLLLMMIINSGLILQC